MICLNYLSVSLGLLSFKVSINPQYLPWHLAIAETNHDLWRDKLRIVWFALAKKNVETNSCTWLTVDIFVLQQNLQIFAYKFYFIYELMLLGITFHQLLPDTKNNIPMVIEIRFMAVLYYVKIIAFNSEEFNWI